MQRNRFQISTLLIMAAFFVNGCANRILAPRTMELRGGERAAQPAMAVEASGVKHLVWVEYSASTSYLVYTRTHFGTPELQIQIDPPEGQSYNQPDIAVDGFGNAFIVFSQCQFITCHDKYAVIPANSSGTPPVALDLPTSTALSNLKTSVVARGSWVYAVYEVPLIVAQANHDPKQLGNAMGNGIYYRQLQGGNRAGKVLVDMNYQALDASPGIDANGDLIVALKATEVSTNQMDIRVYSNQGLSADMDPRLYTTPVNDYLSSPSLTIGSDGAVYVAYAQQTAAGQQVYVRELGVFNTTVPYGSLTGWELLGNPQVTSMGADFYVAFSARNSISSDYEIWGLRESMTQVAQITDNLDEDGSPLVSRLTIDNSEWPLIAWRTFLESGSSTCYGDGYLSFLGIQKVHVGNGACENSGQDMASAGEFGGAIWIDAPAPINTLRLPWVSFNAYGTYLPFARR